MLIIGGIVIGFLASFISALFGGGAGLVMVPGIYWLLAHHYADTSVLMQMTFCTGSCLSIPLGIMASWKHTKYRNVDKPMLRAMLFPMMFGGIVGVITIAVVSSAGLKSYFSIAIVLIAIWLMFHKADRQTKHWPRGVEKTVAAGVGFISTTIGVSVFSVPLFMKFGLSIKKAIGTSTVIVFAYSSVTAIGLLALGLRMHGISAGNLGYLNMPIFLSAVIPALLGSIVGAKLVSILPPTIMKVCFIALMFIVAGIMMIEH